MQPSLRQRQNGLECGFVFADNSGVETIASYRRAAMKLAVITELGENEGYAARIPGFRGLLAIGSTRKQALAELNDALVDWITLAAKRRISLPTIRDKRTRLLSAA